VVVNVNSPSVSAMTWRPILYLGKIMIALACLSAPERSQEIRLLAEAEIPAASKDQFGETIGGLGSGLAFNPANGQYLAISDRGPGDGTTDYRPRFHTLDVKINPGEKFDLKVGISTTTLLRDRDSKPMTGLLPDAPDAATPRLHDGPHLYRSRSDCDRI
jgi:hypothetical protein